jgi:hypothetical protein
VSSCAATGRPSSRRPISVVASALAADCETIYTEDLQDGQVIEERVTIRSPFKAPGRLTAWDETNVEYW